MDASWKKSYDKTRQCIKKQRHHLLPTNVCIVNYGFSSSHVWMWELDHIEGWELKNWCFWTVVLEKTLESPWTAKRSNQSILKEINPEYSLKGLVLKLKLQYFCYLMRRGDSLEKTLSRKDWEQEEKGVTEDEMVGWHHWLNGHELEQTQGDSERQGSLECCSSRVAKSQTWLCRLRSV